MPEIATIRKRQLKLVTTWQAIVKRKGYPTQRKTFSTKAGAQAWARKIERQIETGHWRDTSEADNTTVTEALDRYLREVAIHKKGDGHYNNKYQAANIKRHKIAHISLSRLRGSDVAEYRDERAKVVAANTVRLELALLSHMFTVARSEWGMEFLENPVKSVRKPSLRGTARDRRLLPGEETKLLAACEVTGQWWLLPVVRFALETAARRGEIFYLRWEDVDFSEPEAVLRNTKNGETRSAPLSSTAVGILNNLPRTVSGSVFGIKRVKEISDCFKAACETADIKNLHFHDLRHEATSRLFELGTLDSMEVASITGHKTLQMLKRYTHLKTKNLAKKLR